MIIEWCYERHKHNKINEQEKDKTFFVLSNRIVGKRNNVLKIKYVLRMETNIKVKTKERV